MYFRRVATNTRAYRKGERKEKSTEQRNPARVVGCVGVDFQSATACHRQCTSLTHDVDGTLQRACKHRLLQARIARSTYIALPSFVIGFHSPCTQRESSCAPPTAANVWQNGEHEGRKRNGRWDPQTWSATKDKDRTGGGYNVNIE